MGRTSGAKLSMDSVIELGLTLPGVVESRAKHPKAGTRKMTQR